MKYSRPLDLTFPPLSSTNGNSMENLMRRKVSTITSFQSNWVSSLLLCSITNYSKISRKLQFSPCNSNLHAPMEKPTHGMTIICCCTTILLLDLIAVSTSIAAEFKRTKARDLKLDGNLCSLPGSPASGLGITALICLLGAQILGTCVGGSSFCCSLLQKKKKKLHNDISAKNRTFATILLVLSWITCGLAILLLGVGTSMNKRQPYGEGWLNGECYVVKGGVYVGGAMLGLVAVIFLLSFLFTMADQESVQSEPGRGHTQKQSEKTKTQTP